MSGYQKLNKTYIINVLIINLVTILFLGCVWVFHEFRQYNLETKILKNDFIESEKSNIKNEVENAIKYIDTINKDSEKALNIILQSRVNEVLQIVNTIYQTHKDHHTDKEIKTIIKSVLRKLKYDEANNYVFALSDKGIEELYPPAPENEGKNMLQHPDSVIRNEIENEINLGLSKGEGIIQHKWVNPETNKIFRKVTYIKYFKPFKWIVGTGIDYEEFIKSRQYDVILRLSHVRFGMKREGYLFANYQNGDPLLTNGIVTIGQSNKWNLTDPFGIKIIQEQYKASQKADGDYIYYSWRKIFTVEEKAYGVDKETSPKISYIKGYQPWNLMIGAGFYKDDIDLVIARKREFLHNIIRQHVIVISLSILISIIVSLIIVNFINSRLTLNFGSFIQFFSEASQGKANINLEKLNYAEFKELAISANNMIQQWETAEQGFKQIVEVFPFPICLFRENKIYYLNPQWIKLIGYTLEDIPTISKVLIKCFPEADERNKILNFQQGNPEDLLKVTCKDGQVRFMKLNYIAMNGKQFMVTLEDYNNRKKVEDDLNSARLKAEEADNLKSAFLANMSHEIRTPMNAIIGFSELLQNENLSEEKRKKYLLHINRSSEMLLNLISDILDISKIEAGQLNIFISAGNLENTFASVDAEIKSIQSTMGKNEIKIISKYELELGAGIIQTDLLRLKQVMMNLLMNALKFTNTGTIEFGCYLQNNKTLQFYVKDTGIGIKPNNINSIFNRFMKIEDDKTQVFRGAGLGLAITKKLVEALGGNIWIKSVYGEGSTFLFTLPYQPGDQPRIKKVQS